jgi:hypothetical protein
MDGTRSVTSTATKQPPGTYELPPQLFRHWIHSREEDQGDIEFYRPEDFDFPPAFGRDGLELRPDGVFIQDDIGPADEIIRTRGHWTAQGHDRIEVRFGGAREDFAFTVVGVDDSLLRIRKEQLQGAYERVPCATDEQLEQYMSAPPATGFRRIDFEHADIVILESFPPRFILRVRGTKPYANMNVQLVPLVYIRQPEYWGIEVVGSLPGIGLPALAPYEVTLAVTSFLGAAGIEVIGATRQERFDIDRVGGVQ